jgi:alpha-beta hydrolase superfamily lysophospholipase
LEKGVVQEKGIQNWEWVQAIARAIDKRLTGAADFTIETFLIDVYLYVNKPSVTRSINKIIEEKLTDEPTLVIGHSLGSVVGYKVMMDNLTNLKPIKYITVGSPLGLKAISSKLGLLQNPGKGEGVNNFV